MRRGSRSAASVEAATGIGLREPWTNPTGTRICGRPCLERRQLREDRLPHLRRALARHSQLRHRRRVLGIREVRGPDEAHLLERQLVARPRPASPARRARAPVRASCSGVRRKISSSNSGQRPSPTDPSGSTASTPSRRSGNASATCKARCPPHEWPTTYACPSRARRARDARRPRRSPPCTVRRSSTARALAAGTRRRCSPARARPRGRAGSRSRAPVRRAAGGPAARCRRGGPRSAAAIVCRELGPRHGGRSSHAAAGIARKRRRGRATHRAVWERRADAERR